MYEFDSKTWSLLPDMNTPRYLHGCGLATKSDGTSAQAVVAGGNGVITVEIFDFIENIWRYSKTNF